MSVTAPARLTAELRQIPKESVKDRVYAELKDALMRGDFEPGQSLTIQNLSNALGTSPMPIREALHRLVSERALVQMSNRSLAVPELTPDRYTDILRVRISTEGTAAAWAAKKISDEGLKILDERYDRLTRHYQRQAPHDYLIAHRDFHFAIYEQACSDTLVPIIESLWLQTGPYLNLLYTSELFRMGDDNHAAVLDALRRRDATGARKAIEHDLKDASKRILSILKAEQ